LLKTEFYTIDFSGKKALLELFFDDYKEFGPIKGPSRILFYRDRKLFDDSTVLEMEFPNKIEPELFSKP